MFCLSPFNPTYEDLKGLRIGQLPTTDCRQPIAIALIPGLWYNALTLFDIYVKILVKTLGGK